MNENENETENETKATDDNADHALTDEHSENEVSSLSRGGKRFWFYRVVKWVIPLVLLVIVLGFIVLVSSGDPRFTTNDGSGSDDSAAGPEIGIGADDGYDGNEPGLERGESVDTESGGADMIRPPEPIPGPGPVPPPGDDETWGDVDADERYIISTATAVIGIELDEMENSVRAAEHLVNNDYDGHVESREERYSPYQGDVVTTRLTFRVPAEHHQTVLAELSDLGEVESINESSDDVTGTIVELDTRIENAESSLERLREFMDEAESVEDLLSVEQQLEQRQANLEVMMTQRERLGDQAEMSTLNIVFEAEVDSEEAVEEDPFEPSVFDPEVFTDGLDRGWSAVIVLANTLLAGLGLLLPWSPVLLAAVIIIWVLVAKNRKKTVTTTPAPTETEADAETRTKTKTEADQDQDQKLS